MEKEQIKNAIDFLGVKILSPLEEKGIVGGMTELTVESHHHNDEGRHHQHHDVGIV